METKTVIAERAERLDVYLSEKLDKTRSAIKKLIEDKNVTVNGKVEKAGKTLREGDEITVILPDPVKLDLEAENIPLDIIYQDEDIAIINKPQGMTVHAGNGVHGSTLVNALLYHLDSLSGINGVIRPGIVHRIDKDTSGLLVVAKNDAAHVSLSEQIKNKTCHRIYLALVEGVVKENDGVIDTFIGRSDKNRTMMAVKSDGRRAVTHYKVIKRYKDYTLMEFSLETGRTHQIRVHFASLGAPLVGDTMYGKPDGRICHQALHCCQCKFTHPVSGRELEFFRDMPDDMKKIME